jgi:signal transduction histidine kinase
MGARGDGRHRTHLRRAGSGKVSWSSAEALILIFVALYVLLLWWAAWRAHVKGAGQKGEVPADALIGAETPRQRGLAGNAGQLRALIGQFIGRESAMHAFEQFAGDKRPVGDNDPIDDGLADTAERFLGGALGSALARRVIDSQFAPQPSEALARVLDEAALAVRFNRELLQTTLDNLSQGVTVVDQDLRLVAWNDTYIDLFHIPPGFLYAGKPVADVIAFTARGLGQPEENLPAYVEKRLEQIRNRHHRAYERQRADGRYLRLVSSPMPGGRYVTSYTDVSELREAAIALHTANAQLEERVASRTRELTEANLALAAAKLRAEHTAKAQARFLAAASHDVLQPLQAARLFIGAYMECSAEADPEATEMLENADMALDSADRLLRALLNLSRLEFGAVKPAVRAVEVGALLEELCREFEFAAREKGLRLRMLPTREWVLSDRDLLRSVLQNLIGNAIRYTRKGAVLVCCRRDAGGLRLEVRDSGPGIPAHSQEAIFGEFSRLSRDREFGPGTGLGLSIAKRICTLLAHGLTVRSAPGRGSKFSVLLPRGHADRDEIRGEKPARLLQGLRVLCIENDPVVLQGLESLLRKWKVDVTTAPTGAAALALLGGWDIIIADYHLEASNNGLDLIAAMRGRAATFALLTADQSVAMTERAAILNVEIIRKPVAPLFLRGFLVRAHSVASMGAAPPPALAQRQPASPA